MNRDNKPNMDKVKIGGIVYEIEKITDLQGKTGEWGHIEYKTCRIVLDDSASQQIEDQTLIHEITHGILVEAGYINHEEEQADRIGKILYQVLVDNDFSWLKNRKQAIQHLDWQEQTAIYITILTASKSRRFSYALNMALKGSTIGQVRSPNKSGATGDGEHLKSLAQRKGFSK